METINSSENLSLKEYWKQRKKEEENMIIGRNHVEKLSKYRNFEQSLIIVLKI